MYHPGHEGNIDMIPVHVTSPSIARGPLIFHVRCSDTAANLKELIRDKTRMLPQEQRLFANCIGGEIHNRKALWELRGNGHEPVLINLRLEPINLLVLAGGNGPSSRLCLLDADRIETVVDLPGTKDAVLCSSVDWTTQRALTGGWEYPLYLWDLTTGNIIRELAGHTDRGVFCLAVDWASQRAVSGGQDCALKIWDLQSCTWTQTLTGHVHPIFCVELDCASRRVVSGSQDRTLRFWNMDQGETLHEMRGHSGTILCVAVDWSWGRALSGSWDCTLRLWDLNLGETLTVMRGHSNAIFSVAMDFPNGRAVSGSSDCSICVWDIKANGQILTQLTGHTGTVMCLAADWTTNRVLSGSQDTTLRLWDTETAKVVQTIPVCVGEVRCVDARFYFNNQHQMHQPTPQVLVPR